MPTDLFNPTTPHDTQDDMRIAMIASHADDLKYMHSRGIIPPWLEDDNLLDHDEHAILAYIADRAPMPYNPRELARALGYLSNGNFKASVIKCRDRKLLEFRTIDGVVCVVLSVYGSCLLDAVGDGFDE